MLGVSLLSGLALTTNNNNKVIETNAVSSNYTKVSYLTDLKDNDRVVLTNLSVGISGLSNNTPTTSSSESSWVQYIVTKTTTGGFTLKVPNQTNKYVSVTYVSDTQLYFTYSSSAATLSIALNNYLGTTNYSYTQGKTLSFFLGCKSGETQYCFYYYYSASEIVQYASAMSVYKLTDTAAAKEWATTFENNTSSACKDPNADNSAALANVWTTLKNSYNALSSTAQAALKNNTSGDSTIASALARYTHIVNRYSSLDDFMGLRSSTSSISSIVNSYNSTNNAISIAIVIVFVGVTSIGGYVLLKKKRQ